MPGLCTLTPRIGQFGADAKPFRNPSDRVVDVSRLLGAQIQQIDPIFGTPSGQQHRIDAVLHIEIGLSLLAVAEHVQACGIGPEFPAKIEDVAVRVTLSQDRHEAKDVSLESEALAVSLDHAFGSELRGAIQGSLDREGCVLGCWKHLGLAVDRSRR